MRALLRPFVEAVRSVAACPRRGVLLAITAALAVAAMVATRSLLTGQVNSVVSDLRRLGLRTLQVQPNPGDPTAQPVTAKDLEQAREIGAQYDAVVLPAVVTLAPLSAVSEDDADALAAPATPVLGTGSEYLQTLDVDVAEGRFFSKQEELEAAAVIVLDSSLARALFGGGRAVGETVRLTAGAAKGDYDVVGVLADPLRMRDHFDTFDSMSKVRSATARLLAFRNAYVPRARYRTEHISAILLTPGNAADLSALHDELELELRAEERGLFVWSRRTWANSLSTMMEEQSVLANLVWGVVVMVAIVTAGTLALLVSADRIGEVAVRRVEGATRLEIFVQFVVEGALASSLGGAVGALIGWGSAVWLAADVGLVAARPRHAFIEAAVLAVAVGALGAAVPALRAAFLDPSEALRER